nr:DNA polymerase [White spot syndrome virus]
MKMSVDAKKYVIRPNLIYDIEKTHISSHVFILSSFPVMGNNE